MAGFTVDITNWVNQANGDIKATIRKIAFDLGARIIMRTPVDTGRARGNWVLGIGNPQITSQSNSLDANRTPVNDLGIGASSAKNRLLSGLSNFDPESGASIFITNSVPYIARLEYGYSGQAPQGMVRLTVAEFMQVAIDAVRLVRSGGGSE